MQRFFSSMLGTRERCMDGSLDLANKYPTLGEHMARLGETKASFKRDLARVLPQFDDLALLYLNDQHERFISNVWSAQQIRELAVPIHNNERVPSKTEASPVVDPDNAPEAEAEAPGDMENFEQILAQESEPEDQGEQSSEDEQDMEPFIQSYIECAGIQLSNYRTVAAWRAEQVGEPIEPEAESVSDPDNVQFLRDHFGISEDMASNLECCLSKVSSYFVSRAQHLENLARVPPNETEAAPVVNPDNAQPRDSLVLPTEGQGDMDSNTPDVPETMVAVSEALADDEHNKREPEETVESEMAAQEETVNQQMAASAAQEETVDQQMAASQVPK